MSEDIRVEPLDVSRAADSTIDTPDRRVPLWVGFVAVGVAFAVLVGALTWWQARDTTQFVVRPLPDVRATDADASGCPLAATCEVREEATPPLRNAVARIFPTAQVLGAGTTVRVAGGAPIRTWTTFTVEAVDVTVIADCETGGTAVPRRRGPLTPVGPSDGVLVVPSQPGCSVAVAAHTPAGLLVPIRGLEELAYDQTLPLRP